MKFIDLFSGMGGFRLGLENSKNECVFSADFDEYACKTYEKNFGEYPLVDITQVNASSIPDHDLLCAGFPCQPFSIAGYRKGFDDVRGTLFFDIYRILKEKKPNFFILENVKGLINHDKGNTFQTMINYLAKNENGVKNNKKLNGNLGYNIFWKVLNASDFGLPQNRERIYIVGFKDNVKNFDFPKQSKKFLKVTDILDKNPIRRELSPMSKTYIKKYLSNHKNFSQIKNLDYLIAYEIRKSRVNFRFDNLSPCLTTKMGTGGNNVPYLVKQDRFFTLKECLKIQGFPENYKLVDSYSHSLRQIGNSVAVPVVKKIYNEIEKIIK
jgi:DNA (cytosine-5)-methyltransferase 1